MNTPVPKPSLETPIASDATPLSTPDALPIKKDALPGIAAVASHLARSRENEDDCATSMALDRQGHEWPFLVVADGVGGARHGGMASRYATAAVVEALRSTIVEADVCTLQNNLLSAIRVAKDAVVRAFKEAGAPENTGREWSTTLLIAQETAHWIGIAYLGDGAIFHAPAEYALEEGDPDAPALWRWRNLLSPHLSPYPGDTDRLALSRYLSADETHNPLPTVHLLAKEVRGDALILCTDGVASANDDRLMTWTGRDGSEVPLLSISPGLLTFGTMLVNLWQRSSAPNAQALEKSLNAALPTLRKHPLASDDDATVGVLLTHAALALRWKNLERPVRRDLSPLASPLLLTPTEEVAPKTDDTLPDTHSIENRLPATGKGGENDSEISPTTPTEDYPITTEQITSERINKRKEDLAKAWQARNEAFAGQMQGLLAKVKSWFISFLKSLHNEEF